MPDNRYHSFIAINEWIFAGSGIISMTLLLEILPVIMECAAPKPILAGCMLTIALPFHAVGLLICKGLKYQTYPRETKPSDILRWFLFPGLLCSAIGTISMLLYYSGMLLASLAVGIGLVVTICKSPITQVSKIRNDNKPE